MRIAAAIFSPLLLLCACTATTSTLVDEPANGDGEHGIVTIQHLKSLAAGTITIIGRDISIEGTVIANDWLGELYKTVIVSDETGGIEVRIDSRRVWQELPINTGVRILCNGMALERVNGTVRLGMPPTGEYSTDRISAAQLGQYVKVTGPAEMPAPSEITAGALQDESATRFVSIGGLHLVDAEAGSSWCDPDYIPDDEDEEEENEEEEEEERFLTFSDRHFVDRQGDTLVVRTLDRCHYRGMRIPQEEMQIAGVVDRADGRNVLRIINCYIFYTK